MTVARTSQAAQTHDAPGAIIGATAIVEFSATADTDTTVAIPLGGLIPWRIINESGAAATLTFYDALTQDGTALDITDEDGVAALVLTLADDESRSCQACLSGCTWLVVHAAVAASGFTLKCMR